MHMITTVQLSILLINANENLRAHPQCYCKTGDDCFACKTATVMAELKEKTGLPIIIPKTTPPAVVDLGLEELL